MPLTFVRGRRLHDPDPILVADQLAGLQNLHKVYGTAYLSQNLLWILRKNPESDTIQKLPNAHWNRRLVPFRFNRIQRDLINRMSLRNICLKPRQAGYTTFFINIRLYVPAVLEPGSGCLLISQNSRYAGMHFAILQRAQRYVGMVDPTKPELNLLHRQLLENLLHTTYSSRRELVFDQLDSRIVCESAEVEEAGQGITLNHVVGTEVPRWSGNPEETLANMKEAIAAGGTLDLEGTANGWGGYFFEECMRARDIHSKGVEFSYFFHEWWWHDEYRLEEPLDEDDLTADEALRKEKFNLDLYQMAWRRKKIIDLRHNFPEKYPEDDLSCFLRSGRMFMDVDVVSARKLELVGYKPLATSANGQLKIFHRRLKGRAYIIGADPAEGKLLSAGIVEKGEDTKHDWSVAHVLDKETGQQMATYRSQEPPEDFASAIKELAVEYNGALVCCERNKDGGTVLTTLEGQLQYGNIYYHMEWWKVGRPKVIKVRGFPTTPKTRPLAVNEVAKFVRSSPEMIFDVTTIDECLVFVRDEKGVPKAQDGAHDDCVMALAIGNICRLVELQYLDPLTWATSKVRGNLYHDEDAEQKENSEEESA